MKTDREIADLPAGIIFDHPIGYHVGPNTNLARKDFFFMIRSLTLFALICMATSCLGATKMTVGNAAPDFELKGSDGKTYKLSSFKDKQAVVIAWYPKAFTGG